MVYRIRLWILMGLIVTNGAAQTNTFPLSGNVGIGTTNPAVPLDVSGYLHVSGNAIPSTGPQGTYLDWNALTGGTGETDFINSKGGGGGGFAFMNGDSGAKTTLMFLSGSGNLGIGTTSPGGILGIGGASIPMGITTELGGVTPLLNFDMNFRESTMDASYPGAAIRIDARSPAAPLIQFLTRPANATDRTVMAITEIGNVGIGTTTPQYPLSVNGTIQAKEVLVNTGWADYVFQPGYRVRPLAEVATFIKANHRLPDIPSETEVRDKGIGLADMQTKLLAKIEELTLQMIQLDEKNRKLDDKNRKLTKRVAQLEER